MDSAAVAALAALDAELEDSRHEIDDEDPYPTPEAAIVASLMELSHNNAGPPNLNVAGPSAGAQWDNDIADAFAGYQSTSFPSTYSPSCLLIFSFSFFYRGGETVNPLIPWGSQGIHKQ